MSNRIQTQSTDFEESLKIQNNNNRYSTPSGYQDNDMEASLKVNRTPIPCLIYADDYTDDDLSHSFGQVTHDTSSFYHRHDTSSFYWHGSSPADYSDPFSSDSSPERRNKSSSGDVFDDFSVRRDISVVELPCKVLMIGDPGVGKTSLVQRYVNNKYTKNYKWTVGVDFALKVIPWSDNVTIKLQLWDIAGQERFTSMTRVYYRDAHACVVMFDLSQRGSFLNALMWKKDLDQKCQLPDGSPVPCILLANKCDLSSREVDQTEIEAFCKDQSFIGWTETSVKQDLMVDESMRFLLDDMVARYAERNGGMTDSEALDLDRRSNVQLTKSPPARKQSNCAC